MPVTDACRARGRARLLASWTRCWALAFAVALAVPGGSALAGGPSHGTTHQGGHKTTSDDDSDDNSPGGGAAATPSPAGGGSSTLGGSPGNMGASGAGGAGHGVSLQPGALGGAGTAPTLGLGFNNNSASASVSIPFGAAHPAPHNEPELHPAHAHLLTIPFPHTGGNGLSHALSYGETGGSGNLFGGSPGLTNRLIHSVTTTYSDRFVNRLGSSLRDQIEHGAQESAQTASRSLGAAGGGDFADKLAQAKRAIASAAATPQVPAPSVAAPTRAPARVVNERFGGLGGNPMEARVFTIPAAGETRYEPRELVVGVPAGLSTQEIAELARRNGLAPVSGGTLASSGLTLQRWRITDDRTVAQAIRALQGEADLQSAQPNYRFALAQAAGFSQQPAEGNAAQYAPAKLHLAQAHRLSVGRGVIVAVIDTGIDRSHPELAGAIAASFDAVGDTERPDAHGTAIAGAIVAHARLTGVAPGARLLAIRAFSAAGADAQATTVTIVRSIEYAMAQGARIINMSFAGAKDPLIARAIAEARRRGIVLIAAAGNAGPASPPLFPGGDPNVIAVTATDIDDQLLDVANRGRQVAIAAPGVDVLLPAPHARYQVATGTSFAAAHVAGIAALMLARSPRLTPDQVRAALVATAHDLGPKGRDDMFGYGLADAYRAVLAAAPGSTQTVAAATPSP